VCSSAPEKGIRGLKCTNNDCQNEFASSSPIMRGIYQTRGDILTTAVTKKMDFERMEKEILCMF